MLKDKSDTRVLCVSTYPPRECGIATYTLALSRALDYFFLRRSVAGVAVSNKDYSYKGRVISEILQSKRDSYIAAAEFINNSPYEVVNIQHEYGIFGGTDGDYLLDFMEKLEKPCVTTLHTVLPVHPPHRRTVTKRILELSDQVVVMTERSRQILVKLFKTEGSKIRVIPHGVPNVRPDEQEKFKKKLKVSDRFVVSTFGLINPGKGIEYALEAVAETVKEVPNLLYLIIGETHPEIRRQSGEAYRESLEELVRDLGIEQHVQFINRYLSYDELVEYLQATDVYIAPQTDPHQAASGTIAYAIGVGTAIIGTETAYAKEVLANGRGYLVDFFDAKSIGKRLVHLAKNPQIREKKRLKTYLYGRRMIWPVVAMEYLKVYEQLAYGQSREHRVTRKALSAPSGFIPS